MTLGSLGFAFLPRDDDPMNIERQMCFLSPKGVNTPLRPRDFEADYVAVIP